MSTILANLRIPLELSFAYRRDSSSAAWRYMAMFGKEMGNTGYGVASVDGIVYTLDKGESAPSRSKVGRVDSVYDHGRTLTSPLVYFRAPGKDAGTG